MARKSNPNNDPAGSPASAAPARARRVGTPARPQHLTPSAETPVTPVRGSLAETSAQADTVALNEELTHEQIARLAYALWEARGCQGGNPEEDWLRAEQQLRQGA